MRLAQLLHCTLSPSVCSTQVEELWLEFYSNRMSLTVKLCSRVNICIFRTKCPPATESGHQPLTETLLFIQKSQPRDLTEKYISHQEVIIQLIESPTDREIWPYQQSRVTFHDWSKLSEVITAAVLSNCSLISIQNEDII